MILSISTKPRRLYLRWLAGCVLVLAATGLARAEQDTLSWFDTLPRDVRDQILWSADYESGNLHQWQRAAGDVAGSGVFNTGGADAVARATRRASHTGRWGLETTIRNAFQARNGKRAVRLMIWTDRPWDQGGGYFPNTAYYSTWIYFPAVYDPAKQPPWDPGDGGWWNVFQFKSEDATGESRPVWTLNVARRGGHGMYFYLYSDCNQPAEYRQPVPRLFGPRQWVHVEAIFESATGPHGRIAIFQDGVKILDARAVVTSLGGRSGDDTHPVWGIGNYTDHIVGDPAGPGRATIYFDDSAVSTVLLGPYATRHEANETSPTGGTP